MEKEKHISRLTGTYEGIDWEFYPTEKLPSREKLTATACIAVLDNTVALVRNSKRGWELPGGHWEKGETIEQAVIREVAEEACCQIKTPRLFGVQRFIYSVPVKQYPFPEAYIAYYTADIEKLLQQSPKFQQEIHQTGLFSKSEAQQLLTQWYQKQLVAEILDRHIK